MKPNTDSILEKQLRRWKMRQMKLVKNPEWDEICVNLSEIERAAWERIANADTPNEINWLLWNEFDAILARIEQTVKRKRKEQQ